MDRLLLSFLACLVLAPSVVSSSKLLGIPFPTSPSHYFNMFKLLNELGERGHDVAVLTPLDAAVWSRRGSNAGIQFIFYGDDGNATFSMNRNDVQLEEVGVFTVKMARNAIEDAVLQEIRGFGPDLALCDAAFGPCMVLTELLALPTMGLWPITPVEPFLDEYLFKPSLSFVPQFLSGLDPTVNWSFVDRLKNLWAYVDVKNDARSMMRPAEQLAEEHNLPPYKTLLRKARMILVASDFAVDNPAPIPPYIQYVGPLLPEPPEHLPGDLTAFVNAAGEQGVVLVSFGTVVSLDSSASASLVKGIVAALTQLPCHVIWSLKGGAAVLNGMELGSHILVSDWIPQNDLLGHPNVKAFVTHGGHNSIMEAAYHGIPIVAIPFFVDQFDSAQRAAHKGFGLVLQQDQVTGTALSEAIIRVTSEAHFRKQAKKVSFRMRKHKRRPVEVAGDWVEHVLATGMEQYLAPRMGHLSWYELQMLDCYAFIGVCLSVVAFALLWTLRFCTIRLYKMLLIKLRGAKSLGLKDLKND